MKVGDRVVVKGPRPHWAKDRPCEGILQQVTEHLYVIRLDAGFCECFQRKDPNVSIKVKEVV